jgi:hypothetical protein
VVIVSFGTPLTIVVVLRVVVIRFDSGYDVVLMVVDVLLPLLSVEDEPSLNVLRPSAATALPALTEFATVTGPLMAGTVVVVCSMVEDRDPDGCIPVEACIPDCAIAAPLIMPSAAAPASKNLVMCHAFP